MLPSRKTMLFRSCRFGDRLEVIADKDIKAGESFDIDFIFPEREDVKVGLAASKSFRFIFKTLKKK